MHGIIRLHQELLQDPQEYAEMVSNIAHQLTTRKEWHKCVLKYAFDNARQIYVDAFCIQDSDEDTDEEDTPRQRYKKRSKTMTEARQTGCDNDRDLFVVQ
jgi:hypothetical protein